MIKALKKWKTRQLIHIAIFSAILILDQILKHVLGNGCIGPFCIGKVLNNGASFGILPGMTPIFIIAALIVLAIIAIFYKKVDSITKLAFAFIASGTIGNLIDRLFFKGVIDLFSIFNSSAFNIADVSNLAGGILIIYVILRKSRKEENF